MTNKTQYIVLTRGTWSDEQWTRFFEGFSYPLAVVGRDMDGGAQLVVEVLPMAEAWDEPSGDALGRMLAKAGAPVLACQKV